MQHRIINHIQPSLALPNIPELVVPSSLGLFSQGDTRYIHQDMRIDNYLADMSLTWAIPWEEPPSLKTRAAIASSCHSFTRRYSYTSKLQFHHGKAVETATGLCWWATSCKPLRFRCSYEGAELRSAMLVLLYALGRKGLSIQNEHTEGWIPNQFQAGFVKRGRFYQTPIWVIPPKKKGFGCQWWMIMADASKLAMSLFATLWSLCKTPYFACSSGHKCAGFHSVRQRTRYTA